MTRRIMAIAITLVLAAALVGGGTMAWFTDRAESDDVTFAAGTVLIEAGESKIVDAEGAKLRNWNPGDCDEIEFSVKNDGTKDAYIRVKLEDAWNSGPLRLLVVFTDDEGEKAFQLVGVEWDSWCQGCTGTKGPIATGDWYSGYSSSVIEGQRYFDYESYFRARFRNLTNQDYVQNYDTALNNYFSMWCLDMDGRVSANRWYNHAEIYDPLCNPDWIEEIKDDISDTLYNRWKAIDLEAVSYILNHDFLGRGYDPTEVGQAIWQFTNNKYYTRYAVGNAGDIVQYVNTHLPNLNPPDNVSVVLADWEGKDDWQLIGDYYYYKHPLPPCHSATLRLKVCLSGPGTGNEYQGTQYDIHALFDAIQTTHGASDEEWTWSPPSP